MRAAGVLTGKSAAQVGHLPKNSAVAKRVTYWKIKLSWQKVFHENGDGRMWAVTHWEIIKP